MILYGLIQDYHKRKGVNRIDNFTKNSKKTETNILQRKHLKLTESSEALALKILCDILAPTYETKKKS